MTLTQKYPHLSPREVDAVSEAIMTLWLGDNHDYETALWSIVSTLLNDCEVDDIKYLRSLLPEKTL